MADLSFKINIETEAGKQYYARYRLKCGEAVAGAVAGVIVASIVVAALSGGRGGSVAPVASIAPILASTQFSDVQNQTAISEIKKCRYQTPELTQETTEPKDNVK